MELPTPEIRTIKLEALCVLCQKPLKPKIKNNNNCLEIDYFIYHKECQKLMIKRIKLTEQLKNINYELFLKYVKD